MKTNYLQKQLKQFMVSTALFAGLVTSLQMAHAGDRAGNGGSGNEVAVVIAQKNISDIAAKIDIFFKKNTEARDEFPEIDFNQLSRVINDVKIVVAEEKLIDKNDQKRTCLNFPEELLIQCNLKEYSLIEKDVPSQFVLVLHELLGLLEVEESSPMNEELSDSYRISQRLKKYVTKVDSYDLVYKNYSEIKAFKVVGASSCHYDKEHFLLLYPTTAKVENLAKQEVHAECAKQNMFAKNIKMKILTNQTDRGPGAGYDKCRYLSIAASFTCSPL